jgi:hypothetical protein
VRFCAGATTLDANIDAPDLHPCAVNPPPLPAPHSVSPTPALPGSRTEPREGFLTPPTPAAAPRPPPPPGGWEGGLSPLPKARQSAVSASAPFDSLQKSYRNTFADAPESLKNLDIVKNCNIIGCYEIAESLSIAAAKVTGLESCNHVTNKAA